MWTRIVPLASIVVAMAACSAVGQLTVKEHTSKSGARVLAGQAEPKAEYGCEKLAQEAQDWGLAGNMNRAGAMESASAKGANYAYIMAPSEASIGGFNVNAFKDAQVACYKCSSLPQPAG